MSFCGEELIWGADFNSEDCGYEEGGIVATLHCPNCEADYEVTLMDNDFYEKKYKEDDLSKEILNCTDGKIKKHVN